MYLFSAVSYGHANLPGRKYLVMPRSRDPWPLLLLDELRPARVIQNLGRGVADGRAVVRRRWCVRTVDFGVGASIAHFSNKNIGRSMLLGSLLL